MYVVSLACLIFTGSVTFCPKVSGQLSVDFKANNNFLMVMHATYNILFVAQCSYLFIIYYLLIL